MELVLRVVTESLHSQSRKVYPEFEPDPRFNPTWWRNGSAKSPVSYCQFMENGVEVGRAKILPESRSYTGYVTWTCPPAGATEIDLIEIRPDLRRSRRRYGSQVVEAIARRYGRPVIALSLDETSDGFWRSLRWAEHTLPDDDRAKTLFTSD